MYVVQRLSNIILNFPKLLTPWFQFDPWLEPTCGAPLFRIPFRAPHDRCRMAISILSWPGGFSGGLLIYNGCHTTELCYLRFSFDWHWKTTHSETRNSELNYELTTLKYLRTPQQYTLSYARLCESLIWKQRKEFNIKSVSFCPWCSHFTFVLRYSRSSLKLKVLKFLEFFRSAATRISLLVKQ